MAEDYRYYLHERYDFDKGTWFGIGLAVWVIGGILGFIYEVLFFWANSDFNILYWRGGTFGPWLDSYCIASLLIFIIFYRLRRHPVLVILLSAICCTAVQLLAGLGLYYGLDGTRAWNCNLEILNFGSFGGFICVRTFVEFAILSALVIYVIAPLIFHMACGVRRNTFVAVWFIIGFICVADILYNDVICILMPGFTSAQDIYSSLGFRYIKY